MAAPDYDCETLSSRLLTLYLTMRIHVENIAWLTWLTQCIVHAINRITMINVIPSGYPVINTTHAPLTLWGHLRPRQNGHHFPDDILKLIFVNEKAWISIKISLKLVPRGQINNIPALVQIMAWHRPGGKLLSEPFIRWTKAKKNCCTITISLA